MATEIERRFLVQKLPEKLQQYPHDFIRQGYLFDSSEGVVRIRQKGDNYYQTIKKNGTLIREELEFLLTAPQFERLWPMASGQSLTKTRYYIREAGVTVELDVFEGDLKPLVIAEVEFLDLHTCQKYEPSEWFDKEITEDFRYQNNQLAKFGKPE